MRILIISPFFPPTNSIASLRPYSWAKYWTLAGHDITILTTEKISNPSLDLHYENPGFALLEIPLPRFAQSLKQKNQTPNKTTQKKEKGVWPFFQKLRRKTGIFHSCRMPDLTDLWIRPAIHAITSRAVAPFDLIVSSSGPYSSHIVARTLKKQKKGTYWIADFRDRWSDNHIFPGLFPFNLIEKKLESWLMKKADALVTVSDLYAKPFQKKYGKDKVFVIENGFDPEDLSHLPKTPIFLKNEKVRFVYTGSLFCRSQDVSLLFSAISKLSQNPLLDRLEILFVGPEQNHLTRLIEQYKVTPWVKCLGFVSRETALRMQRDADALLFFPWGKGNNKEHPEGVLTGKLFEYLFTQTPLLSIGREQQTAVSELIEKIKRGTIISTEEACKQALMAILGGEKKQEHQDNKDLLAPFHRKYLAEKFLKICQNLEKSII
jgi:glycosyltransferase involved in cell wall biosynthesis